MSDVTFQIHIREDGTPVIRNLKREVDDLGSKGEAAGKKAGGGMAFLASKVATVGTALGGLGLAATVGQFLVLADTARNLEGRLKLVTASAAELAAIQRELFTVAQATRASYEGTVNLYAALTRSTQGLGLAQKDLLGVTKQLNQLTALSGATSEASANALFQLSQAFRGGKLQAEEYNSIIDQAPEILEAMAKGLGLTMGEFRKEVIAGEMTVDRLIAGLRKMEEETAQRFGTLPLTVGQAMTLMGNSVLKAVGEFDKASGISEALANKIRDIATAVDIAADAIQQRMEQLKLDRILQLKKDLSDLQVQLESGARLITTRGGPVDIETALAMQSRLQAALKELQATMRDAAASAASTTSPPPKAPVIPEDIQKFRESLDKSNQSLADQLAKLQLSEQAFVAYTAAQMKAGGATEAQIQQFTQLSLAILSAKDAKDADKKATLEKTEADKRAAKATEDEQKAFAAFQAQLQKSRDAISDNLTALDDQTQEYEIQRRVIEESIGTGKTWEQVQYDIARATIVETAAVRGLTEEQVKANLAMLDSKRAAEQAKAGYDKVAAAAKKGILTTGDLRDGLKEVITGVFRDGPDKIGDLVERYAQGLGLKLIEGIAFGKEKLEDEVLIPNFEDVFGKGGIVGRILEGAGFDLGALFGKSLGREAMTELESVMKSGLGTGDNAQGSGGILSSIFGSLFGKGGAGGGGLSLGQGAALAAALPIFLELRKPLTDFVAGLFGGGSGAKTGAFFGFAGAFLGSLFDHIPTKGTRIRKSLKDYYKDIEASFAGDIDKDEYFFEESKARMKARGETYRVASEGVLREKVSDDDLVNQLLAVGTFLTAGQAKKVGKDVEQTAIAFGSNLADNLGTGEELSDALKETIQKGNITFEGVMKSLNKEFKEGRVSVDFYKKALEGATTLLAEDLPTGVDAALLAIRSLNDDGTLNLEKFNKELEKTVGRAQAIAESITDALLNALDDPTAFQTALRNYFRFELVKLTVSEQLKQMLEGIDLQNLTPGSDAWNDLMRRAEDLRRYMEDLLGKAGLLPDGYTPSGGPPISPRFVPQALTYSPAFPSPLRGEGQGEGAKTVHLNITVELPADGTMPEEQARRFVRAATPEIEAVVSNVIARGPGRQLIRVQTRPT